jgi:F420-non-reducing hydrogenase large subunit
MAEPQIRQIKIDPVTRLEGHGKIEIFLDERGNVEHAYFQVPELRGFEKFCEGRLAEEMPQITSRICGVCPTAHHLASVKALDSLYQVEPPPAARMIREAVYNAFLAEDHILHFYFLGGPDFILGPSAPPAERNILGVIRKVGLSVGQKVITARRRLRELIALAGGKAIHPVLGLPGGVAKPLKRDEQAQFLEVARETLDFAVFTFETFEKLVLKNTDCVDLIRSAAFTHRTYYMGMVDRSDQLKFCDGSIRVVSPDGREFTRFQPNEYLDYIAEHVEPWTYAKFCFLKTVGWKGFTENADSGVYSVGPLARLNASERMATPLAQEAREKLFALLGGKPVHQTLATHWARIVELLYAAERLQELSSDPQIVDPHVRTIPTETPREGFGVVEAPRGTLVHHYQTNEKGVVTKANLIVATQNNAARIALSVQKAAEAYVHAGEISDGVLNMVEMALRAYDPCLGCATHTMPGDMPLMIRVRDPLGSTLAVISRDLDGRVVRNPGLLSGMTTVRS